MTGMRARAMTLAVAAVMISTTIGVMPTTAAAEDNSPGEVRKQLVAAREKADRAEQRQEQLEQKLKEAGKELDAAEERRGRARDQARTAEAERSRAVKRARVADKQADRAEARARAARATLMRLVRAGYAGSLSTTDLRMITDFIADGLTTFGDFAQQSVTADRVQDRLLEEAAASAKAAKRARGRADRRKSERARAKVVAREAKQELSRAEAEVDVTTRLIGKLRDDSRAARSTARAASKRYVSARESFRKAFLATCNSSSSSGGSAVAPPASSGSQADIVWSILLGEGFTEEAAAGVLGNLQQESGVDPTARQNGGPGRGLAQWTQGGRWDSGPNSLLSFAGNRRLDPWDAVTQTRFMLYEMRSSWGGFDLERFKGIGDITEAVKYFHDVYERSADSADFVTTVRAGYGKAWYARLTGSAPVKSAKATKTAKRSGETDITCP